MKPPLRLALIGLGEIAQKRHIPAILRDPAFHLTGVIDRHEGRAQRVAAQFHLPHFTQADSLDNIAWLDRVEAVMICTPVPGRAQLVRTALEQGKHVLVEKPFALSSEEGAALGQLAQQKSKTLAVVHNFLFSRGANKLRADKNRGRLGKIVHVGLTYQDNPQRHPRPWREELPFGAFFDDSPHDLYLMQDLAHGTLTLQQACAVPADGTTTPRFVQMLYQDESGVPFSFQGTYDASIPSWTLQVSGTGGTGLWDLYRDIYHFFPADDNHGPLAMARTSLSAVLQHLWGYVPNGLAFLTGRLDYGDKEVLRRFAQAVRTNTADGKIDWTQALTVLKQQHEAIKAMKERGIE